LFPAAAGLGSAANTTVLALTLGLQPGSAVLLARSDAAGIEAGFDVIRPDPARVPVTDSMSRIALPPGTAVATLVIGADPRTITPFRH
jgi:hypothetical protein